MKRSRFLRVLALSSLFGLLVATTGCALKTPGGSGATNGETVSGGGGSAGGVRTIRIGSDTSENDPITRGLQKFADLLAEKTGGQIKGQVYANNVLGDDTQMMQGTQAGTLDVGITSFGNASAFTKKFQTLELGFLFPDSQTSYAIVDGPIGEKLKSDAEKELGIKILALWDTGGSRYLYMRDPVKAVKPAELHGKKVRTTTSKVEVAAMKALGAIPTPLPWGQTLPAIQQGTVDGVATTLNYYYFGGIRDFAKHVVLVPYQFSFSIIHMSNKLWTSLTPEQQKAVMEAAKEAETWQRQLVLSENKKLVDEMFPKEGITVYNPSPEELSEFRKATHKLWDDVKDQVDLKLANEILQMQQK